MAYQPSNSGQSVGMAVKDQQSRSFRAQGDAWSSRTIFFEHLVSWLVVRKQSDNNINLLGNFNKNVYSGWLARRLAMVHLNFVSYAKNTLVNPFLPPTAPEAYLLMESLQPLELNVSMHSYSPTMVK